MKKLIFNMLCLFAAVFAHGQTNALVIEGNILNALTGAPLAVVGWKVEAIKADSVPCCPGPPAYFGSGVTDQNGHYVIEMPNLQGATGGVLVQTYSYCADPNGGTGGGMVSQFAQIANGHAQADFSVCPDPQPPVDCYAYGWYDQNTAGLSVQLHGEAYDWTDSTAVFSFLWTFPDGTTSTDQNPSHTFPASGDYVVSLTATSASCSSTSDVWVYLYEPYSGPVDTVTVSGHIYDSADSTAIADWYVYAKGLDPFSQPEAWTDSAGFYSMTFLVPAGDSSAVVFADDQCTGVSIAQNVALAGGHGTADFYLCGNPPPPPGGCWAYIKFEPTDTLTYQFYGYVWSNDPNGSTSASYLWDFGDGATSTEQNPTHAYAQDGVYSVSLMTVDSSGCEGYADEIVCTLGGGTVDTFYYGCQAMFWAEPTAGNPRTLVFHDNSFGEVSAWTWYFPDNTVSHEAEPSHTFPADGLYTITLVIQTTDSCESKIAMDVYVGDNPWNQWGCQAMFLPIPADSTGGTGYYFYDFSSSKSGVDTWTWNFGDNTGSLEQNPFHVYAQPGIYKVSLTIFSAADSCSSVFSFDLDTNDPMHFAAGGGPGMPVLGLNGIVLATAEQPDFQGLRLFPNPSSDAVNLTFNAQTEGNYELRVSDLTGKILTQKLNRATAGANAVRVEIAALPQGIYLAQLVSGKGVRAVKFSKI